MFKKGLVISFALAALSANAYAGKDPYTVNLAAENLPNLVSIYSAMNSMCRDRPDAGLECARRDIAAAEMKNRGWCWGPESAVGSDKEWVTCEKSGNLTPIPTMDPKAHCQLVSKAAGTPSELILRGCMTQEQLSYNELKAAWSTLPQAMRDHCTQVAMATAGGSYMILNGCIQQELQAKKTNSATQFQY